MSPKTSPGSGSDLKLQRFEWTGLIEDKFLNSTLTGALGAGIGSVYLVTTGTPPWLTSWHLFADVPLTVACLALAYLRVWKTIHEEHETNAIWAEIAEGAPRPEGRAELEDRVMELPYLLSLTALPLSAILPQVFLIVLFVFYWSDNYYNAALIRGVAAHLRATRSGSAGQSSGDEGDAKPVSRTRAFLRSARWLLQAFVRPVWLPPKADRSLDEAIDPERLGRYFYVRFVLDLVVIVGALLLVVVTFFAPNFLSTPLLGLDGTVRLTWLFVVVVFAIEWLVEPHRNLGHTFHGKDDLGGVISVGDVHDRTILAPDVQARLDAIHREAFGPEEQQYSMEHMLEMVGRPGRLFRIIHDGDRVIGYIYLGLAPESATAFLWYMAIDRNDRNRGAGGLATRDTLDLLRRDHPDLRYAMFEVHRPSDGGAADAERMDQRRVAFYRRLGAYWVRGVDYRIPAAGDSSSSVAYDPMFFALRGSYLTSEIRACILAMARDNFEEHPDDERWLDLQASVERMTIIEPAGREAG